MYEVKNMYDFSYEELRMIRFALENEIIRRENNQNTNLEKLKQYEELEEKVFQFAQLAEVE